MKNKSWVQEKILEYEKFGFVKRVDEIPYVVCPLTIKQGHDKISLIHDESALNAYVKDTSFKLDSWDTLFDYVIDSEYVIKYDLKKYYYSIKIHKDDQKYFGFCFPIDGILTYFCWTVLPFGYKLGPFIAKKVMGPLIIRWRHMQIHNIIYFDDGAATSKSSNFHITDASTHH